VGALARGIAHRFNNVLGSITGQIELWGSGRQLDEFSQQRANRILQAVENGKDLVAQIKTFANRDTSPSMPADLPHLMRQTVRFIKSVLPAGIEVIEDIPDISCRVYGEPEDLRGGMVEFGFDIPNNGSWVRGFEYGPAHNYVI